MPFQAPIKAQPSPWNTGNELVDTLLNALFPTDVQSNVMNLAMPPGLGTIARPRTPEQGLILTLMNSYFPQMMKKAITDPRKLNVYPFVPNPDIYGYQRPINQFIEEMGINPGLLLGKGTPATGRTIGHETTHFLTNPRGAKTEPIDAATIAQLLSGYLPQTYQRAIAEPIAQRGITKGGQSAAGEAFSYLGEAAGLPESPDIVRQLAEALGVTFR